MVEQESFGCVQEYVWGWLAAIVCVLGFCCAIGRAELQPSQVFVVYNRNLPASREVAEYYMKKRGVPTAQSIGLDLPAAGQGATTSAARRTLAKLRAPLRGWLRHENLQDTVKCLVTVYGVPLRVAGTGVTSQDRQPLKEVNAELDTAMAELEGLIAAMEKFTSQPEPTSGPAASRFDPTQTDGPATRRCETRR